MVLPLRNGPHHSLCPLQPALSLCQSCSHRPSPCAGLPLARSLLARPAAPAKMSPCVCTAHRLPALAAASLSCCCVLPLLLIPPHPMVCPTAPSFPAGNGLPLLSLPQAGTELLLRAGSHYKIASLLPQTAQAPCLHTAGANPSVGPGITGQWCCRGSNFILSSLCDLLLLLVSPNRGKSPRLSQTSCGTGHILTEGSSCLSPLCWLW